MNTRVIILTAILLCFSYFGFSQSLQFENQIIEQITIEMVNLGPDADFDMASVTSRIKAHEKDLFSQTDFDNDLKTLAREFDRVEPILNSVDGRLFITLKVWPKPTIRLIKWTGNEKIKCKHLQKELGITTCSVFDRQAFNKAFHKLKAYYVKNGFFEASLYYEVTRDPVSNDVDIEIFVCEGRAGRIKNLIFSGLTSCEENEILEMMVTKEYCFFTSWLTDEGTYHEEAMQQDQFVITNYLQNKGYADAQVQIEICEAQQNNRINIHINAEKGQLYQIGKITFDGNKIFPDEIIWDHITFEEGDCYSPDEIRETVRRISNFYGRRGYIDAIVDYEPYLESNDPVYSIHLTIEEGEQFCVGLIKVFGNCSTQTNVILHETLLIPGEVFNIEKLELTEQKLRNIGYFKHVNVYAVKSDGPYGLGGCFRDVHIEVEETVTGNFGAGFGISSVESIFGEFRITERNFNYKGLGCLWTDGFRALRGGGEYLHLSAMVGAKSRKYALSWTKPFFMDSQWVVGFEVERSNNRYVSKEYEINATGITTHGSLQVNQFVRLGLHYRLRNTDVQIKHAASCLLKDEARNSGLISAAGVTLSYDSTNHPTDPTCGFKSRLEEEFAGLGGNHTFLSLAYLNSYFIPAGKKGVIKLRGDVRFIIPMFRTSGHDIPIDERLFLGGNTYIRGYRAYKLGPQYPEGDPRGGLSLQFLSAEYSRQITKRFDGFVFCDAGSLSFDLWSFNELRTAIGFGFRVRVLESGPPLMLGMGFPLNPRKRGDVKRFFFTVGGTF